MASPVLEHLRSELAAHRNQGWAFEPAWAHAIETMPVIPSRFERELWHAALHDTRDEWDAAYRRVPSARRTRHLSVLIDSTDREPLRAREPQPNGHAYQGEPRTCAHCAGAIPDTRRPGARYCSCECQLDARRHRQRAATRQRQAA